MSKLKIHYHRYDGDYNNWTLWTWLDDVQKEIHPIDSNDYGLIFEINLDKYPSQGNINFLPKYKNWEAKDAPNRFWDRDQKNEVWILPSDPTVYTKKPDTSKTIQRAFIDSQDSITVTLSHPLFKNEIDKLEAHIILDNGDDIEGLKPEFLNPEEEKSNIIVLKTNQEIKLESLPGRLEIKDWQSGPLLLRKILDNSKYQTDQTLGVGYSPKKSIFTVFSPGATRVLLNIYDKPKNGAAKTYSLEKVEDGVWRGEVSGDLRNKYYTYQVDGPDPYYNFEEELIDPYALATTSHDGRGIIIQDDTPIDQGPSFSIDEAIIYEMHIRDFTIDRNSGVEIKGKFPGFHESGTKLPGTEFSTGLDHLVELGINTVQIMPIQDFEHVDTGDSYFWGYMPVNFNAPDGWYSTDHLHGSGVKEFKKLVDAFHKKGIKVVMDVVYNHTAETSSHIYYNFNGFIPNFYYREKPDGSFWNGSGTGNETRSENPMVRRFIVESLKYWVKEYKVDGFRFDLMGLHDMKTMKTIVRELQAIKPDIFIYGEPWTAGSTPIDPTLKGDQKQKGFAVFNDHFRDALKGPWHNTEPGYIQEGLYKDRIKTGITGSIDDFAANPQEVINYVVCHDGRTLWDRIIATTKDSSHLSEKKLQDMDKLAAVLVLTSQGVPFLHGGQEILRTKFGSHNSYNLPDKINKITWSFKEENHDIFAYYKGLIKLRKEHPVFRMTSKDAIKENITFLGENGYDMPQNCIGYLIKKGNSEDRWPEVLVLLNPNHHKVKIPIPKKRWTVVVNEEEAGTEMIEPVSNSPVELEPISALIMYHL
ncbi:MAG: type I pullulanase [Candidatus Marinimicrobia bacterium]|nr:type I pullulanase [Candidatus Neomarinimicrobiota bacterium]